MKAAVIGSANIDHFYHVNTFVRAGMTVAASSYEKQVGGKGVNQSIALARAGVETWFVGAIGPDGDDILALLEKSGVRTEYVCRCDVPTGHALIQVDPAGQNCIITSAGANNCVEEDFVRQTLTHFDEGNWILLQNEINTTKEIIPMARERGLRVALNPSPFPTEILTWPLDGVDLFFLNESEGKALTGVDDPNSILDNLRAAYPQSDVVLTLGEKGACYAGAEGRFTQDAFKAHAVDTTGAGDTFSGYFLRSRMAGEAPQDALRLAACASAISLTQNGAGSSIPAYDEVIRFLNT